MNETPTHKFNFKNPIVILSLTAVVVFGLIFGVILLTQNWGKTSTQINEEALLKRLDKLYTKINVTVLQPRKDNSVEMPTTLTSALPDINSSFPLQVSAATEEFIEIFSSPEKAGANYESWLIDVANNFNKSGAQVDGKNVSVAVRNISSGTGVDYISSGKYTPDVFAPSAELWGEMLSYQGKKVSLAEKSIAGNVAGIVLSKAKHAEMVQQYGAVNSKTIVDAVLKGELAMGYTNPFVSTTGLNFLLSTLYTIDSSTPLGDEAISQFQKFQDNIPYVAYNTMQMRESAKNGSLNGFVLEYQTYVNAPDIKSNYIFTPFGVRHDQPVYEIGDLSPTKQEIVSQFIAYCKTPEMQRLASEKGFNGLPEYVYEFPPASGEIIASAQQIWKKEKHGSSDLSVVFVADVSGSMEGDPILKLKESLHSASNVILPETRVGIVTFSSHVNIALPIAPFDINQRAYFSGAVKAMRAEGSTAMFDGIVVAMKMLLEEQEKNSNTKLMLIVLTDGETNVGCNLSDVEGIIRDLKLPIYTIGYNANIAVLENLSQINEATSINAETDDVIYKIQSLFNAQM
ncbi:MAG: VWA domain-containing protein [Peptococcaceae bacterium]|nr:VWA domain-containing protein [Peptococcaceae bacterium]